MPFAGRIFRNQINESVLHSTVLRKSFTYTQINSGAPEEVFPLLCPVREHDWLDGWQLTMLYSQSGLIEQDCVFATPYDGQRMALWQVTLYDHLNYLIEFVRMVPATEVVKINIRLRALEARTTETTITYQFTILDADLRENLQEKLAQDFYRAMSWWEKAINHYLQHGNKLLRSEAGRE